MKTTEETVSILLRYIIDNATENKEQVCTDYDNGDGYMLPPMASYEPSYSYEFDADVKVKYDGTPLHVIAELDGELKIKSLIVDFPCNSYETREFAREIKKQLAYCKNITFNF